MPETITTEPTKILTTTIPKEIVLLIGGGGSRMLPLTKSTPKPLLPFCEGVILEQVLKQFIEAGIETLVFAMARRHMPAWEKFCAELTAKYNIKCLACPENEPLGTGGPIASAVDMLPPSPGHCFVINCDIIARFPVMEMWNAHLESCQRYGGDLFATILTTAVEDPSRFGVIRTEEEGDLYKVNSFVEKPTEYIGNQINAGVYIINKSIVKNVIKLNQPCSIERDVFPSQLEAGKVLKVFPLKGFWNDLGKPKDYLHGQRQYLNFLGSTSWSGQGADIGCGSSIGENVSVANNAKVGEGAILTNCSIWAGAVIAAGVRVSDSIIGENCTVTRDCLGQYLEPNSLY